jgi:hypothetical protein
VATDFLHIDRHLSDPWQASSRNSTPAARAGAPICSTGCTGPPLVAITGKAINATRSSSSIVFSAGNDT